MAPGHDPEIGLDPYTAVVALAHVGHIDDEALKLAMRSECFYVGALGSKETTQSACERLKEAGFQGRDRHINSPIGINIGAQSPPEIAIAIMAQLVLALRGPRTIRPPRRVSLTIGRPRGGVFRAIDPGEDEAHARRLYLRRTAHPLRPPRRRAARCGPTTCWRRHQGGGGELGFAAEQIEDVVVGCANQGGEDSRCVARHAALVAGLPIEIPGSVLQRNCGSGLNAIAVAAQAITCGEGDVFVAGGVESMSRAPFVMSKAESAVRPRRADLRFDDRRALPEPEGRGPLRRRHDAGDRRQSGARLPDHARGGRHLRRGLAAANTPRRKADGFFAGEIIAVEVPGGRAGPVTVAEDEHPRPQTDLAALAKLRPLFKGGVTTAGNASGINDGAVAMIVASRKAGEAAGAKPLGAHLSTGRRRRAAAHHGHRPGAGLEKGARARRPRRSRTWT